MKAFGKRARLSLAAFFAAAHLSTSPASALNLQKLDSAEESLRASTLQTLDPVITPKKQDGTAILLTWDQLYAPLSSDQKAFLDAFRALRAEKLGATSHYFGEDVGEAQLTAVGAQSTAQNGETKLLDPQYLPRPVLESYRRMMAAMKTDLGKQLLVESGYRSPAYQLYLFLYYMSNHGLSAVETNKHVALPGHSEHGAPHKQAIDFINEQGINGEDHPEEFEALPEYAWLVQHANVYGFFLSYPRNNVFNTAFEPWHWHYEADRDTMKPKPAS